MTDLITSSPTSIRRPKLPLVKLPNFDICTTLAALSKAITLAFDMAYVAPYRTTQRQPLIFIDRDLEGRDPNW